MKKIILAITGSIAAVKTYDIIRALQEKQLDVQCVVSTGGKKFVSKLALESLTQFPVLGPDIFSFQYLENPTERIHSELYAHIEITKNIDAFVIAPLSANTLSDIAHGKADTFLLASILTNTSPVVFAPAMNTKMWESKSVQENIETLQNQGYTCIPPQKEGILACGDTGSGKMATVQDIVFAVEKECSSKLYTSKKILINTGSTQELIDPVRYIGNRASGKTGIFLASHLKKMGAEVELIHGETTAQVMYDQMNKYFETSDIIIFSAAVSDYSVINPSLMKIKKKENQNIILELRPNIDIAKTFAERKKSHQTFIGFALETCSEEELMQSMIKKSKQKKFDIVIGNYSTNIGSEVSEYIVYIKKTDEWKKFTGAKEKCLEKILFFISNGIV